MWLKALIIFVCTALLGSAFFFIKAGTHAKASSEEAFSPNKEAVVALFENKDVTLTLYKSENLKERDSKKLWSAQLILHTKSCKGGLGLNLNITHPKAFLSSGSIENGTFQVVQPATLGEAACNIRVNTANGIITNARELNKSCSAWHGAECNFAQEVTGAILQKQ